MSKAREFFLNLRRWRVFRVVASYIGARRIIQGADLEFPQIAAPEYSIRIVWIGAHIGFSLALTALSLSGCAVTSDGPLSASDRILGSLRGSETVVRLKSSCSVPSDEGSTYVLPDGDYTPVAADSRGIFYDAPRMVEVRHSGRSVLIGDAGIHIRFGRPSRLRPSLWVSGVNLERGTVSRVKRWPLPQTCWQPYGATLVIVHNKAEVASPE